MTVELEGLVPKVIPNQPLHLVQVTYTGDLHITPGLKVRPRQICKSPLSVSWKADPDQLYTLMMFDPDAPSRQNPSRRDCLHWMVINIPGGDIAKGQTKAAYIGSGAPKDSGEHRYVMIICQQPGRLQLDKMPTIAKTQIRPRVCFQTLQFLEEHQLRVFAATFLQAEWDDYVPELYAQFTDRV